MKGSPTVTTDTRIIDEAIDWHLRQPTMSADDWAAFVVWLEADAAHRAAYDRVALADRQMPSIPEPMVAANDDTPAARRWPWLAGGSIAAALVAALALPVMTAKGPQPYAVETAAGERRAIALDDGTRIDLSGGTRVTLDRSDPRVASLDRGQAVFAVRHDAGKPFTLTAGALTVRDVGTVFDVARTGARLNVEVAEGSVMVQPDGERILLAKGQTLAADPASGAAVRGTIDPDAVGGWRSGRIAFTRATLADVAATWQRLYGTKLVMAGELPNRPFTGMVELTGKAERDVPHVAALIGVNWRRRGDEWIIGTPASASR
jgi:transmembrane sensor